MAHMTTVKCQCCKTPFEARTADVNRGWGKYCSKSCKATKQYRRTRIAGAHYMAAGRTVSQMDKGRYAPSQFAEFEPFMHGGDDPHYTGEGWGASVPRGRE